MEARELMDTVTILMLGGLGLAALVCIIGAFVTESRALRRSKDNPYTYFCPSCGQEFNTYGITGCHHHDTIEPVYKIKKPDCRCHNRYRNEDWFKEEVKEGN